MTAATDRKANTFHGTEFLPNRLTNPVAATTSVKKGWHCARNAAGFLVAYTAATGLKSAGVALEDGDNTTGADGDIEIDLRLGLVDQLIGTAGDALVDADAPCACYALDNQTVGKTSNSGARSLAGVFMGINQETGAARVLVGPMGWYLAQAMARSAAGTSGTATLVAGTVTVTSTAVTADSKIFVSRKSKAGSTALGELSTPTRTAGTSFVIIAQKPADGTTETGDVSTVDWMVVS